MMQQEDTDNLQIVPDPDKLERYHRQQLSAMLDGELSPDQARFMLRRLQHDTALAGCWERWQVCGDVLRGQHNALLPADFARKVSAAIAGDVAAAQQRPRKRNPRLLRWGGGAALAASVAMAALLVGRQADMEPGPAAPQPSPAFAVAGGGVVPAEPAPAEQAPADPVDGTAPAAAAAAAAATATALAAADAPRRMSGSRSRTEVAGASDSRAPSNSVSTPRLAAVAAADQASGAVDEAPSSPLPRPQADTALAAALPAATHGIGADPFKALPMTTASRPWPRATGTADGYAVGFTGAMQGVPAWQRRLGPVPPPAIERFGLPAEPAPLLEGATAIGTRPVPGETATRPAAAAEPR